MRKRLFRRTYVGMFVAMVSLALVGGASAASGVAPTFSVTDYVPALNDFATLIMTGLAALLVPVLVIKGPFWLWNMLNKSIHKLFGRAKPTAAG